MVGTRRAGWLLAVLLVIAAPEARAQTAPEAPPEAAPALGDDERKAAARERFEKGVKLFGESAWSPALAEFLESRRLYATKSATTNIATCLRKLERFDEALDMFEMLLREFPDLAETDRVAAQRAVAELRGLVGTIEIGGAEVGAAIVIDGKDRGDFPSLTPLRVAAGSHVVRVYKEGYAPFEGRVDVAGGHTAQLTARLRALARSGRLRVAEKNGKVLEVVVDGVVVGKTPWEGALAIGSHVVALRGEGDVGTQPAAAPVRQDQVTPLTLVAETLEGTLRVEPTPAGASVSIDSVVVGNGIWEGRLRAGAHLVEVASDGFLAGQRQASLDRGEREVLTIALDRDSGSAMWRKPSRLFLEVSGAALLSPGLGGDVAGGCESPCSSSIASGGYGVFRGGYELGSGLGFGVGLGYLQAEQGNEGRPTTIQPVGLPPRQGRAGDDLALSGFLAGAWAGLSLGEPIRFHPRLGAGVLFGKVADDRTGHFGYRVGPVGSSASASFFYVDPELRVGYRVARGLELSVGIEALVLIGLTDARWDETQKVNAAGDGVGTFAADSLVGSAIVLLAPGLGARYEF